MKSEKLSSKRFPEYVNPAEVDRPAPAPITIVSDLFNNSSNFFTLLFSYFSLHILNLVSSELTSAAFTLTVLLSVSKQPPVNAVIFFFKNIKYHPLYSVILF